MSIDGESLPETYNFEVEKKVAKPLAAVEQVGWTGLWKISTYNM